MQKVEENDNYYVSDYKIQVFDFDLPLKLAKTSIAPNSLFLTT